MKLFYADSTVAITESSFDILPDSSLLRNNEHFYIPNFSENITASFCLLVKVHKLGKCFAERFAHRYYSQLGFGIDFRAETEDGLSLAICRSFDKSLAISQFAELPEVFPQNIIASINGKEAGFQLKDGYQALDKIISQMSQYFTFKIGDVVVISLGQIKERIAIGDSFTVDNGLSKQFKCLVQ